MEAMVVPTRPSGAGPGRPLSPRLGRAGLDYVRSMEQEIGHLDRDKAWWGGKEGYDALPQALVGL